jgi:putative membrane protein
VTFDSAGGYDVVVQSMVRREGGVQMMWGWDSGWGWFWMSLMMVAFWVAVAWVIVTLVRGGGSRRDSRDVQGILDERFARGEIDEDEYRRRRDLIRR